jgi:acyl-CoA thioesterase-1
MARIKAVRFHKLRNLMRLLPAGMIAALLFAPPAHAGEKTILVYGDSLTAGLGLSPEDGFIGQLQAALDAKGLGIRLINASVSGDTTQAGRDRLDWSLADKPDAVILELGANDMLRGLPTETVKSNLSAILDRFSKDGVPVLLAGMMADRGLGPDYVAPFDAMYPALAKQYGTLLYPFFLDGVALDPKLNQADMQHPNPEGVKRIVARIFPYVQKLVEEIS